MGLRKAMSAAYRYAKQHMPGSTDDCSESNKAGVQPPPPPPRPRPPFKQFEGKNFSRTFHLGEQLGKGSRSTVFKATLAGRWTDGCGSSSSVSSSLSLSWSSSTTVKKCYAVKRTMRKGLSRQAEKCLLMEVHILRKLQHPNVVGIYQFYQNNPDYYYMVLDLVTGGALYDRIVKKATYNEEDARDLCRTLLNGVKYCHDMGVVHRDLKPENILLCSSAGNAGDGSGDGGGGGGGGAKLCDFGLARSVRDGFLTQRCGTPYYMAPELLLKIPYGTSVDMWSVGIIIYTMLAGYFPFYDDEKQTLYAKIKTGSFTFHDKYWSDTSDEAKDLIKKLLTVDQYERITANDAVNHPWLRAPGRRLSRTNLGNSLQQLQVFNAKGKLRAAVKTIVATQNMLTSVSEFHRVFDLGEELGRGTFATVLKATVKGWPDRVYAVKRTNRRDLHEDDEKALLEEVRILRTLEHSNVVELYQFYEDDPDYYYVVLEYMAGGELFDRIVRKSHYSEEEARDLCQALLNGVKYCHSQGVVHRDLKPENLLFASLSDGVNIKIADFGLARRVHGDVCTICSIAGTPEYLAPEMLKWIPYGTSVDMWSVGVIIYVILSGYLPFHDKDQTRLFRKIKMGLFVFHVDHWDGVSSEAKDLISKLLTVDHTARITASEALRHPWLRAPGRTLSGHNLGGSLEQLQVFNAKRKLRAAVKSASEYLELSQQETSEQEGMAETPNATDTAR